MEYYTITTNAGDEEIAQAIQSGTMTTLAEIAVGDGNGAYYEPEKTQAALRREVWRGAAQVTLDANNAKRIIAMTTIPAAVGGFTIREAGIFGADGTLMVIAKLPLSEKVAPESGASSDLIVRLYVEVSDTSAVTITIDPSAVLATKKDVKDAVDPVGQKINSHISDAVAHMTQEQKNQLISAVQSATLGGAAVPKSGTGLQLPAYPTSLPANGGHAAIADSVNGYTFFNGSANPGSLSPGQVYFQWG